MGQRRHEIEELAADLSAYARLQISKRDAEIERLRAALIDVERATWMEGPHEIGHYARVIVRCRTIAASANSAHEQS